MRLRVLLLSLVILLTAGVCYAQQGGDDLEAKLAVISGNNISQASAVLDELLHSQVAMTRNRALEAAVQSKERRIREVGYIYLLRDMKKFIVELSVPQSSLPELEKQDKIHISSGKYQEFARVSSLLFEIENFNDSNNTFKGRCPDFRGFEGSVAAGSINIVMEITACSMKFNGYIPGYITGALFLPGNSFAAKIALP